MNDITQLAALVTIVVIIAGAAVAVIRYVHAISAKVNDRMDERVAALHKRVDEVHQYVDATRAEFVSLREFTNVVVRLEASIGDLKTMIERHEQNTVRRMDQLIMNSRRARDIEE